MINQADGGGDNTVWLNFLTPTVVLTLAGILLVLLLILALTVWRVVRRLRRSGALERGLLNVRAQGLPPGTARELAALRLRLRAGIQSTTRVATHADNQELPSSDLTFVVHGLQRTASAIDADLQSLERDPDAGRQREGLQLYQREVDELLAAGGRVRDAVSRTAAVNREAELRAVSAQVDEQVSALEEYRKAYRELGGGNV